MEAVQSFPYKTSKRSDIPRIGLHIDLSMAKDTEYRSNNGDREDNLPSYSTEDDGHGERPHKKRTSKEKYALALQKACNTAVDRVKSNNMIENSPWATSLVAAPNAIATMAILFKVADREEASDLEVDSLDIIDIGSVQGGSHQEAANAQSTTDTAEDRPSSTEGVPGAFSQDDEAPASDGLDAKELDIKVPNISPPVGRVVGRLP